MLVQTLSGAARRPRRQKREAEVEVDGADQPTARVGAGGALAIGGSSRGGPRRRLPNSGIGLSAGGLQVRKWKKFWATLSRTDTKDGISGAAKNPCCTKRVLRVSKGSHDTLVRETSFPIFCRDHLQSVLNVKYRA